MNPLALVGAFSFPILERIPIVGDFAVSPHGLGIAIGFGLGAVLMMRRAEKRGLGHVHVPNITEAVQELLTRAAIGAILGARFFYVLTHLDQFEGEWIRVLYAWEGGLTFLGGVTGAVLLAIPFARKRHWRMTMLLDSAAPGIALGLAIGRIGDLMIGDHIGAPTDFPLAWRCTGNYWVRATNSLGHVDPLPYPVGGTAPTAGCFDVAVHHTALYDFGATVIVLLVLLLMERRRWFDGAFMAAWIVVYGSLRIASDFARNDRTWAGLTGSQWSLVAAIVLVAVALLWRRPWRQPRWAWDLEFDHPWKQGEVGTDGEPLPTTAPAPQPVELPPLAFPDLFAETSPDGAPAPEEHAPEPEPLVDDAPDDEPGPSPETSPEPTLEPSPEPTLEPSPEPPVRTSLWGEPLPPEPASSDQPPAPARPAPAPGPAQSPPAPGDADDLRPRPRDPDAPPRMARNRDHRGSDA